jgi:hypothetical protein
MYVHPRLVRRAVFPMYAVEPADVEGAIAWLDAQWRGDPSVRAELLPVVAVA